MENRLVNWSAVLPEPPHGPAIYWRHKWGEYATNPGLPFSRGTMQNYDSEGHGPKAVVIAGKVAYPRETLIAWLNKLPMGSRPTRTAPKKLGV